MHGFEDLVIRARDGDRDAVSALYDHYGEVVMRSVRSELRPGLRRRFDTLDLVHSVFLDVLRDLGGFEVRSEQAFQYWLHLKARNKVRDKFRHYLDRAGQPREQTPPGGDPVESAPAPWLAAATGEEVAHLEGVFGALDEEVRAVLRLRLEEGLGFAEVASRLDLPSAEAARKRYRRAMEKVRTRWKVEPAP